MPSNVLIPTINSGIKIRTRPSRPGNANERRRNHPGRRRRCYRHIDDNQDAFNRIANLPPQIINDQTIAQFFNGFLFY